MKKKTWALLQLFAAEGASGETAADAGQQTSQEQGASAEDRANTSVQDAAAEQPGRLTWEQIMADPEYNRQMQETIKARLKAAGQAWEKKQTQKASPREAADVQKEDAPAVDERALRRHYQSLVQQGEALKKTFPGFDLEKELQDPAFVRLTAPGAVSVEDAYYALHRRQLQGAAMQVAARKTAQKLSNAMMAGTHRPQENGTAAQAPSVADFDYRNASRQQREELKKAIRTAGAKGEKLYPTYR